MINLINSVLLALPVVAVVGAFALDSQQRVEAKDRHARKTGLKLAP